MGRARHTLLTSPFVSAVALLAAMLVVGSTLGNAEASTSIEVRYRVNAGGPAVADTTEWIADTAASPSPYVTATGNTTLTVRTPTCSSRATGTS